MLEQTAKLPRLSEVPIATYVEFEAEGFEGPVSGVVYDRQSRVVSGMPLGGVDTGCLDVETSGLFGYSTIFNSHVPRGGPMNEPFLGVVVGGQTWVLSTGLAKSYDEPKIAFAEQGGAVPVSTAPPLHALDLGPARLASDIRYWGHYPVVDMEYTTDAPVVVSLRAWSPFIPGDLDLSMLPGAVFEVHLTNTSGAAQEGEVLLSFPGPTKKEAGRGEAVRQQLSGPLSGEWVRFAECEYALGVSGEHDGVRTGGCLGADGAAWARAGESLPALDDGSHAHGGLSLATGFRLAPGESARRVFVLSWRAPSWWGEGSPAGGGNRYTHVYSTRWRSAHDAAVELASRREELWGRVLAWQEAVYVSREVPVWLRSALVNILHLIAEDGLWAVARGVGEWCSPQEGLFGMNECPRGCAQIECIPCSFYGAVPLPYFFPVLARSTLEGYRHYQYPNGEVPWVFGGVTAASGGGRKNHCEMIYPSPGYQTSLNGVCYVALVDRYWRSSGDASALERFYGSVKAAVEFTVGLRPEYEDPGQRVLAMPSGDVGTEWFEAPEPGWFGVTNHVGGLHLAMLAIAERMARAAGDTAFAKQCAAWREAGQGVMESEMWTGAYYRACLDPESGKSSDLLFAYQLDGEWLVRSHGLGGVFDEERVSTTLDTIWKANVALTRHGAVNYASQDGGLADVRGYGPYSMFPPEVLMLAMTYMYAGQVARGEELARRCWENIECRQGLTWDQPNVFRGDEDTGERTFGADYYQNMMLWALPAAFQGKDLASVARPGGLVHRVLRAGNGKDGIW